LPNQVEGFAGWRRNYDRHACRCTPVTIDPPRPGGDPKSCRRCSDSPDHPRLQACVRADAPGSSDSAAAVIFSTRWAYPVQARRCCSIRCQLTARTPRTPRREPSEVNRKRRRAIVLYTTHKANAR
jgi:hypothetical protein